MTPLLARERTALFLYVVLVLLPAVVFGGLFAHRLWSEHRRELDAVPATCRDAVERLAEAVAFRLEALLAAEEARPFFHFQRRYLAPETAGPAATIPSPLESEPRPRGVLGWYAFDPYRGYSSAQAFRGVDPGIALEELLSIARSEADAATYGEDSSALLWERMLLSEAEVEGAPEPRFYTLRVLGVNRHPDVDQESRVAEACDQIWNAGVDEALEKVMVGPTRLKIERIGTEDELRLLASRLVFIDEIRRPGLPECFAHLGVRFQEVQGVVLDPAWLFGQLEDESARQTLGPSQRLLTAEEVTTLDPEDVCVSSFDVFDVIPIEVERDEDLDVGVLHVGTDRSALRESFRVQLGWLVGLAAVLGLSTAIGLRLLLGRIRVSREEALRTRNFVASVSHELRTPIAAVKLYGEMLADGWIRDEPRKQEYLQRIVRETDRLSALVDRVLLRRKLQDAPPTSSPGDLNMEVLAQRAELELTGGKIVGDVAFDLAPDLPRVQLVPDGVRVILANLVENARKYAPVDVGAASAEPILVRTRRDRGGAICLEVLDRGPGVPVSERQKIFGAFYRAGDERTRQTTGTGLGLHLVALQARAMRGRVEVLPRAGGGSRFKVTLRSARG